MGVSYHCYCFGSSSDRTCPHSNQYWRETSGNSTCTLCLAIKSSSRFERINKLDNDYLYWQIYHLFPLPPEIPRDNSFISPILKRVQRWQVSWIRSIGFWSRLISMSVRCILKVSSFIHSAQSHIKTRHCSAISCTVYRTARPKRRLQGVCKRKLLPYYCLLFAVVCPTKQNRCDEVKWAGKNCTSQKELRFSCQHSNRGGQFGLVHF